MPILPSHDGQRPFGTSPAAPSWIALIALSLLVAFLNAAPASAQLGPTPGLTVLSLGQPNGPAQLGPDGSASSLMALGRTLGARAGDRVNILDAPYGAKCDGVLLPTPPTATISTPGTGYAVGDTPSVSGGVATGPAMQVKVTAVNGAGGITAVSVIGNPAYTTLPSLGAALTGGSGAGATVNTLQGSGYWSGTDDTAAITAATAAALTQRKSLYIPGNAGACLTKTGNPLANISGPMTIEGDGRDVSRLVWFLDDNLGSLSGVAAPGAGYTQGDILTIVGGTATSAMKVKVLAVSATGGVLAATAWGKSSYTVAPPAGAATTGGTGTGATVNIAVGTALAGPAIGSPFQSDATKRVSGVTLRNFSVIGQGRQNPVQASCGGMAIRMYSINQLLIEGMGVDYSRCMSIAIRKGQEAVITRNRIRWSSRDGINTDTSWTVVSDNVLEHVGDDGIAVTDFAPETNALPYREGVVVSGNFLTDTQGIVALGSAGLSVTGNTLVRPKLRAVNVSINSTSTEGSTPTRAVTVTGNTVTDLMRVTGDPVSDNQTKCIMVGSTPPQPGILTPQPGIAASTITPGIPGFPVAGSGEFLSPYPYLNANGLITGTSASGATAGVATPPGMYVTVSGNSCVRTLNASPNGATSPLMFSALGFGMAYGSAGWLDFPMTHAIVAEGIGLDIEQGIVQNLKVTGNVFAGETYGIDVLGGASLLDAEIRENTFRDITSYGVAFTNPVAPGQRILFDSNLWDGDPYFASASRTATGTLAADGNPLFTGTWSTTAPLPALVFQMPSGFEWRRNRIRNWAVLGSFPTLTRLIDNTIYANGGTGVGGTLPAANEGWDIITEDGNPASATFGQMISIASRDLASGCLAGRTGASAGGVQCITPGTGTSLASGILTASLPSNINAATIAGAGVVQSITLTNSGGQYAGAAPSCTLSAPPAGGTQAACAPTMSASNVLIQNGGSGYAVGQVVSVVGGISTSPVKRVISQVDSGTTGGPGVVTATTSSSPGSYIALPSGGSPYTSTVSTTANTGTGTGLMFNINFYTVSVAVTNGGLGYTTTPTVSFSASNVTNPPFPTTGTATAIATLASSLAVGTAGPTGSGVSFQGAQADGSRVRLTATTSGQTFATAYGAIAAGTAWTGQVGNTSWIALMQSGTLASTTLALPSAAADAQILQISTLGAITALTLSPTVPGWTNGGTIAANSGLRLGWDAASGAWLRTQ